MRRSRTMGVGMHVTVVMLVELRRGHPPMLYYNITAVQPTYLRLPDRHRNRGGEEGKRQRHGGAKPDESRRHEGNFPQ